MNGQIEQTTDMTYSVVIIWRSSINIIMWMMTPHVIICYILLLVDWIFWARWRSYAIRNWCNHCCNEWRNFRRVSLQHRIVFVFIFSSKNGNADANYKSFACHINSPGAFFFWLMLLLDATQNSRNFFYFCAAHNSFTWPQIKYWTRAQQIHCVTHSRHVNLPGEYYQAYVTRPKECEWNKKQEYNRKY